MHWWLTGFRWGVLSDASELSVDLAITRKDGVMCQAFLGGIAGCDYRNLRVDGTTVSFTFSRPFAPQTPRTPVEVAAIEEATAPSSAPTRQRVFRAATRTSSTRSLSALRCLSMLRMGDFFGLAVRPVGERTRPADRNRGQSPRVRLQRRRGGCRAQWWSGVDSDFGVWVGQIESYLGLPLDFACYVEIDNTGGASDLVLQSANASEGSFVVGPPTWIPQGMVARLVLRDAKPSIRGSDGTIRYGYSNADLTMQAVTLHFECPTGILSNKATSSQAARVTWAKSTNPKGTWSTRVPSGGHPLFVGYVIGGGQPH